MTEPESKLLGTLINTTIIKQTSIFWFLFLKMNLKWTKIQHPIPYARSIHSIRGSFRADLVHLSISAPVFKNIKIHFCVSKNYKIYYMNTYTYPEYLWKVLVKIALYFELQKKR
jgi:hypothetical protein